MAFTTSCPPASKDVVKLMVSAASKVKFQTSTLVVLCQADAAPYYSESDGYGAISGTCVAGSSGQLYSIIVESTEGSPELTVLLDSTISVNAGDTLSASIVLRWS